MKWRFTAQEAEHLSAEEFEHYVEVGCVEGATQVERGPDTGFS